MWALPLTGDKKAFPIAQSPFNETPATFSPDGRWVTYSSNESGRTEVYAVPFPGSGPRVQISVGGGFAPRWRRDGRELYYSTGRAVVALTVEPRGSELIPGAPRELFNPRGLEFITPAPDGQSFLALKNVSPVSPVSILLNWKPPRG